MAVGSEAGSRGGGSVSGGSVWDPSEGRGTSEYGSVASYARSGRAGSAVASNEKMIEDIEGHMSMLHHLLVFDAWIDLVKSPTGEMLVETLAESPYPEEQRLGRMISQCERSLPQDTDAWIRLFMSSVSELDLSLIHI